MKLKRKKIGFVITGAFGTFPKVIEVLKRIIQEEGKVLPIISYNAYKIDSKLGNSKEFINEIETITRKKNSSYNTKCRGSRR